MKTKLLYFFLLALGLTGIISCEKDEAPLSKEEAVVKLESVSGDYTSIRTDYMNTPGVQVENTFYELNLPFNDLPLKSPAKSPLENTLKLRTILSKQAFLNTFSDRNFNFNEFKGTWTYNPQNPNGWDFSSTPSDKIVLIFPHPRNNATNNAKLTFYDYTSTQTLAGPIMTGLKAKIELNNSEVWSWNFVASYSLTNINISTTTTAGIYTITDEVSYTSSKETKWNVTASFTVKKNNELVFKIFNSASYNQLSDQTVQATVEAKITVKSIEFRFKMTFSSTDINNYENFNPNDYITMSIYTTSGVKVADLVYEISDEGQNWVLWIKFTNGETAPAVDYLGDLLDEVDIFWDLFEIQEF